MRDAGCEMRDVEHWFVWNIRRHGQALLVHACLWLAAVFNNVVARRALPLNYLYI